MPNLHALATSCVGLEPRPLPSAGITRPQRYYGPLRHPAAPGLSLTGVRLAIPDHATGLPVLRAPPLCACCRHYPGTATGGPTLLVPPVVSAFPGMAARSACASSFSRLTQRSLALRPAHSRCHRISWHALPEGFSHFVTSMTAPVASGWSTSPGGAFTHWKTPPLHGARQQQSLTNITLRGSQLQAVLVVQAVTQSI